MSWECPECDTVNDDYMLRCKCGYDDESDELDASDDDSAQIIGIEDMNPSLLKDPIYLAAIIAGNKYLTDETQGIGKNAPQENKRKLAEKILTDVNEVILAPNRILANREKLAAFTIGMAKYQVLILPSEHEDEEELTGLRGKPGITGELKLHLLEIAKKDKEIKEMAFIFDDPNEQDIYDGCLIRYWEYHLKSHVFQTIRIALKDYHPDHEKDWYRPFIEAMCATEEHHYRKLIGLPDVLGRDGELDGDIEALKYSTFLNMVLNGVTYPNFEWEETYQDADLENE